MAKKEKKVSINQLESILNKVVTTFPLEGVEDAEVAVRRNLSLKEMMQFVEDVVSSCVNIEKGDYTPEIQQFAFYSAILTYYGNFRLPVNVEKQYELIYNTNAIEQIMPHINKDQLTEIELAINEKIAHKRNMIESVVAIKTNELIASIENFAKQFEGMFDGISNEDVGGALKMLATAKDINEKALVDAVYAAQTRDETEPYIESDIQSGDAKIVALPKKEL